MILISEDQISLELGLLVIKDHPSDIKIITKCTLYKLFQMEYSWIQKNLASEKIKC